MRMLWTFMMASLVLAATASGQAAPKRQHRNRQTVKQVRIYGNRRVPESEIKSRIDTQDGDKYSADQIDRDVHAVYAMGHFRDVKAFSEDEYQEDQYKIISFEVSEWPLISDITYLGLDTDIVSMVPGEWAKHGIEMEKGSEYSPQKVKRAARVIQDLLVSGGYPSAIVETLVESVSSDEAVVIFTAK